MASPFSPDVPNHTANGRVMIEGGTTTEINISPIMSGLELSSECKIIRQYNSWKTARQKSNSLARWR